MAVKGLNAMTIATAATTTVIARPTRSCCFAEALGLIYPIYSPSAAAEHSSRVESTEDMIAAITAEIRMPPRIGVM